MEKKDSSLERKISNGFISLNQKLQAQLKADIERVYSTSIFADIDIKVHSCIFKTRAPLFYAVFFENIYCSKLSSPEIQEFIREVYLGSPDIKKKESSLLKRLYFENSIVNGCKCCCKFRRCPSSVTDTDNPVLNPVLRNSTDNKLNVTDSNLYYYLVPIDDENRISDEDYRSSGEYFENLSLAKNIIYHSSGATSSMMAEEENVGTDRDKVAEIHLPSLSVEEEEEEEEATLNNLSYATMTSSDYGTMVGTNVEATDTMSSSSDGKPEHVVRLKCKKVCCTNETIQSAIGNGDETLLDKSDSADKSSKRRLNCIDNDSNGNDNDQGSDSNVDNKHLLLAETNDCSSTIAINRERGRTDTNLTSCTFDGKFLSTNGHQAKPEDRSELSDSNFSEKSNCFIESSGSVDGQQLSTDEITGSTSCCSKQTDGILSSFDNADCNEYRTDNVDGNTSPRKDIQTANKYARSECWMIDLNDNNNNNNNDNAFNGAEASAAVTNVDRSAEMRSSSLKNVYRNGVPSKELPSKQRRSWITKCSSENDVSTNRQTCSSAFSSVSAAILDDESLAENEVSTSKNPASDDDGKKKGSLNLRGDNLNVMNSASGIDDGIKKSNNSDDTGLLEIATCANDNSHERSNKSCGFFIGFDRHGSSALSNDDIKKPSPNDDKSSAKHHQVFSMFVQLDDDKKKVESSNGIDCNFPKSSSYHQPNNNNNNNNNNSKPKKRQHPLKRPSSSGKRNLLFEKCNSRDNKKINNNNNSSTSSSSSNIKNTTSNAIFNNTLTTSTTVLKDSSIPKEVGRSFVKLSDMDRRQDKQVSSDGSVEEPVHFAASYESGKTSQESSCLGNKLFLSSVNKRSLSRIFPNLLSNINRRSKDFSGDHLVDDLTSITTSSSIQSNSSSEFEESSMKHNSLGQDLLRMYLDEIDCDVTVEVAGRRIKAHKCILSSRCQYFGAVLSGGWVESAGNVILLHGFSYTAVHFALCHIYSGDSCIPDDVDIKELATLADTWCLEGLKEVISYTLKSKFCHFFHKPCNVCSTSLLECLLICKSCGLEELYHKCVQWIAKHYVRIWPTKPFASLPFDIIDKCYKQNVGNMTVNNVVDVLMNCDLLLSTISVTAWSQPSIFVTAKLNDSAIKFIAQNFTDFIITESFLSKAIHSTWSVDLITDKISLVYEKMTPDQLCSAYSFLHRILKHKSPSLHSLSSSSSSALPKSMLQINSDQSELLTKVKDRLEKHLIKQALLICRCLSWSEMDTELKRNIQTAAGLVLLPSSTCRGRSLFSTSKLETSKNRSKSAAPCRSMSTNNSTMKHNKRQVLKSNEPVVSLPLNTDDEKSTIDRTKSKTVYGDEDLKLLNETKELLEKEKRTNKFADVKPRYLLPKQSDSDRDHHQMNKKTSGGSITKTGSVSKTTLNNVATSSSSSCSHLKEASKPPSARSLLNRKKNNDQQSNSYQFTLNGSDSRSSTKSKMSQQPRSVGANNNLSNKRPTIKASASFSEGMKKETVPGSQKKANDSAVGKQPKTMMNRAAQLRNKFCVQNITNKEKKTNNNKLVTSLTTSVKYPASKPLTEKNVNSWHPKTRTAKSSSPTRRSSSSLIKNGVPAAAVTTLTRSDTFSLESPTTTVSSALLNSSVSIPGHCC